MAGKKGKKGKKGKEKKKSPDDGPGMRELILRKALKLYEGYSADLNAKCCPDVIKSFTDSLEGNVELTKLIVRPIEKDLKLEERFKKAIKAAEDENDLKTMTELKESFSYKPPLTLLEPLMRALKEVQLCSCKELYVIDLPMSFADIVQLTHFVKIGPNIIRKIEIIDCLLQPESVSRFSSCINSKLNLSTISLDYNEFGDKGCFELCKGLTNNVSLTSLSLNYCNITSRSGAILGDLLSTTAIKDLYLDGNDLRCYGFMDLIRVVAEECESETLKKELEEKEKEELELKRLAEEEFKPMWERNKEQGEQGEKTAGEQTENEASGKEDQDGKKKKKKKKRRKRMNRRESDHMFANFM